MTSWGYLSIEPLRALVRWETAPGEWSTPEDEAPLLGISTKLWEAYIRRGELSMSAADLIAVRMKLHPGSIWADYFERAIEELECPKGHDVESYGTRSHGRRRCRRCDSERKSNARHANVSA